MSTDYEKKRDEAAREYCVNDAWAKPFESGDDRDRRHFKAGADWCSKEHIKTSLLDAAVERTQLIKKIMDLDAKLETAKTALENLIETYPPKPLNEWTNFDQVMCMARAALAQIEGEL